MHVKFKSLLPAIADPHADSAVVGITLTCSILLFLMPLTAAGYYFVYKSTAVKEGLTVVILCVRVRMLNTVEPAIHILMRLLLENSIK